MVRIKRGWVGEVSCCFGDHKESVDHLMSGYTAPLALFGWHFSICTCKACFFFVVISVVLLVIVESAKWNNFHFQKSQPFLNQKYNHNDCFSVELFVGFGQGTAGRNYDEVDRTDMEMVPIRTDATVNESYS
jgi:hypothetical protein